MVEPAAGLYQNTPVPANEDCDYVLSAWGHVSATLPPASATSLWVDAGGDLFFSEFRWPGAALPAVVDAGVSDVTTLPYARVSSVFDTSTLTSTATMRMGVLFSSPQVGARP